MSDAIHQEVVITAPPERIYDALTDAKTFSAFTGNAPAEIEARAGGAFSLFGGRIKGRCIELEPNRRLVQAWRAEDWDAGQYSIVRFELQAEGPATRLVFDQAGHPPAAREHLASGWGQMYWEPLKAHLR
jgi:uncharacterized protein YndB with AHSA1/START domain